MCTAVSHQAILGAVTRPGRSRSGLSCRKLTYGLLGSQFAGHKLPDPGAGLQFEVQYLANALRLEVVSVSSAAASGTALASEE